MPTCETCHSEIQEFLHNDAGEKICPECGGVYDPTSLTGTADDMKASQKTEKEPKTKHTIELAGGTTLRSGKYRIIGAREVNAFVISYLSRDLDLEKEVVIQEFFPYGSSRDQNEVLLPNHMSRPEVMRYKADILHTVQQAASFKHTYLQQVLDVFQANNTVYCVLEHISGRTLKSFCHEQNEPLLEQRACRYATQACEAMRELHRNDFFHRDINPRNIIISTGDNAVITNSHLTSWRNIEVEAAPDRSRVIVNPAYSPVEQFSDRSTLGPYTDIYALAATLYEMLTGRLPTGGTDRATGVELIPPKTLNPAITDEINQVILWGLQMRVTDRPQSAMEFANALRNTL